MKKLYYSAFFIFFQILTMAQNLVVNPGFEEGLTGWTFNVASNGKASMTLDSLTPHSGKRGLKFSVSDTTTANWQIQLVTPAWTSIEKRKYKLTFYAKANVPLTFNLSYNKVDAYKGGKDFSLTSNWTRNEYTIEGQGSGLNATKFKLSLGANLADYYFDDFAIESIGTTKPSSAPIPLQEGAFATGLYRNMFKELGYREDSINKKVDNAFQQLFYGNNKSERIYFEVGDSLGYIKSITDNTILTEGLSYGLMIAVQLNKKDVFDRIWRFTKKHSMHKTGPRKGYFAWHLKEENFQILDSNSAPDGEEYFVTALFFAGNRWGNTGKINYTADANELLNDFLHLETRNGGRPQGLTNIFNLEKKQIVFVPQGGNAVFTDPSYHLPAFYKLWAQWAEKDKEFWQAAADSSRSLLLKAMHPVTGLVTDYTAFDGTPYKVNWNYRSALFGPDSWRVIANIATDAQWFGTENWHSAQVDKLLKFFNSQGPAYKGIYKKEGIPQDTANYHDDALVAMNGAATLASADTLAWQFLEELYFQSVPTGPYRYYNGLLHMLGLLQASGKYRIYKPGSVQSTNENTASNVISVYPNPINHTNDILKITTSDSDHGWVDLKDITGKILNTYFLRASSVEISVKDYSPGILFVEVVGSKNAIVKKIVLE